MSTPQGGLRGSLPLQGVVFGVLFAIGMLLIGLVTGSSLSVGMLVGYVIMGAIAGVLWVLIFTLIRKRRAGA